MNRLLVFLLLALFGSAAQSASIDWTTVGNAGNLPDDVWPSNVSYIAPGARVTHGSVDYAYQIGKYEITNSQYAEFLNAVATEDTYELYHEFMNPEKLTHPLENNSNERCE